MIGLFGTLMYGGILGFLKVATQVLNMVKMVCSIVAFIIWGSEYKI